MIVHYVMAESPQSQQVFAKRALPFLNKLWRNDRSYTVSCFTQASNIGHDCVGILTELLKNNPQT